MKIQMLKTRYDDEINKKIYDNGEIFDVNDTISSFYQLKEEDGIIYGVKKELLGEEFIEVE